MVHFIPNPMKKTILLFVIILSFTACQKQSPVEKKAAVVVASPKSTGDFVGTYKGILPCADCQGLLTEIAINENATFSIKTKYQGKGEKVFVKKGHFTWNKKGDVIILTDVSEPNKYLVGKNKITQLDIYGKKITGSLAAEYILSKQPTDTSTIETAETEDKLTVDLDSRIATTTTIQKVNPAVGKYPLAETKWKLISVNKKAVQPKGKDVYYIKLKSKDGRFVAFSGCNNILGNYVMPSTSTLTFSGIISTKMACADMELESHFCSMLGLTRGYKIYNTILTLYGEDKAELGKFEVIK